MKIMYVEDNPANLFLVKRVARVGGHEVINYIDGEDALANFDRDNPDLVLMDIQLAGELNGLQVVERLRAAGYRTPIIAVTAYAMVGDKERFISAGCDDYLAKPLPIPRLVELLESYSNKVESNKDASEKDASVKAVSEKKDENGTPATPAATTSETATTEAPKVETQKAPQLEAVPPAPPAPTVQTSPTPASPASDEAPTRPGFPLPIEDTVRPEGESVDELTDMPPSLKLETLPDFGDEDETQTMPTVRDYDDGNKGDKS